MDGKYILVLVDGLPLTGKFNNRQELNLFDADLIERVEIVKGPSSAIYGSEAMGGVINIITKNIGSDFSVDAKGKTGSFDLYSANARISGRIDSIGFSVNFDHSQGGVDPNLTSLNVRNSQTSILGGKINWRSKSIGLLEMSFSQQDGLQDGQDPLFTFETQLDRTDGRMAWRREFGNINAGVRAYASEYDRDYREIVKRSGYVRTENAGVETIYGLKSDFSYEFFTKTRLDVGFDYSYDKYNSRRNSVSSETETKLSAHRDMLGLFAQIESGPIHNITLLFGGRYDKMSDVDSNTSPRLSGMYNITPNFKMRASYGGGFRAPSFNDMYIDFDHTSFGYRVIGNPDLVPEKSAGSSAGVEYFWNSKVLSNLTFYRNLFRDMIVDYPVDPVLLPGTLSYKNIDHATINSAELQSKLYVLKNLTAQFAYNYNPVNHTLSSKGQVYLIKAVDYSVYKMKIDTFDAGYTISYAPVDSNGVPTTIQTASIPAGDDAPGHFSLVDGVVLDKDEWDVAFLTIPLYIPEMNAFIQNPGMRINSAAGVEIAIVENQKYKDIASVPTGLTFSRDEGEELAIGDKVFDYNTENHRLTPPDVVYIVKTVNGNHAKLQVTAYYHPDTGESGYVNFKAELLDN